MRFRELAERYEKLGATSKRLELRALLVELLGDLGTDEIAIALYLTQGSLRPEYEGVELGVADSLALKAVAASVGKDEKEVKAAARSSGDLGTTAESLSPERPARWTVREVYDGLTAIAKASGEGSQEAKTRKLTELLEKSTPLEAKYVVRFVLGKLRLGVRELTVLDALAEKFGGGAKEGRAAIERAFNLSSDLGAVGEALAQGGLPALSSVRLEVGRPVRPMLAERAKTLAEILERMDGRAALECKYDGLRVQAHIDAKGSVRLFSRRLEELSAQFPELVAALPNAVKRTPAIVEGECVAYDADADEIRPFQEISRRRGRKYELEKAQEEIPVALFLFDQLLDKSEPLLDAPFPERRRRLESTVRSDERIRLAEQSVVTTAVAAQAFFENAIAVGGEGIVAKSVAEGSGYHPGARGFWWIKYKRDYTEGLVDTIDGVVVGAFHGRGRRGGRYGALLLAAYNKEAETFETFCKVGSGFDDALLEKLPRLLKPYISAEKPKAVVARLTPDVWVAPKVVMVVQGAELTVSPIHPAADGSIRPGAGLALRFPRFTGTFRDDKDPEDATSTLELIEMYKLQRAKPAEEPAEES